ncbi:MAG: hypothetical protein QXM12_00600 [Nitrososphaerota archaeon]
MDEDGDFPRRRFQGDLAPGDLRIESESIPVRDINRFGPGKGSVNDLLRSISVDRVFTDTDIAQSQLIVIFRDAEGAGSDRGFPCELIEIIPSRTDSFTLEERDEYGQPLGLNIRIRDVSPEILG